MSIKTNLIAVKSRLIIFQLMTMAGFVLIAFALIYWSIISGPNILTRDDNPRLIEEELSIHRGSILDANNVALAETLIQEDDLRRHYPVEGMGPVVGYYSLRHGTAESRAVSILYYGVILTIFGQIFGEGPNIKTRSEVMFNLR